MESVNNIMKITLRIFNTSKQILLVKSNNVGHHRIERITHGNPICVDIILSKLNLTDMVSNSVNSMNRSLWRAKQTNPIQSISTYFNSFPKVDHKQTDG